MQAQYHMAKLSPHLLSGTPMPGSQWMHVVGVSVFHNSVLLLCRHLPLLLSSENNSFANCDDLCWCSLFFHLCCRWITNHTLYTLSLHLSGARILRGSSFKYLFVRCHPDIGGFFVIVFFFFYHKNTFAHTLGVLCLLLYHSTKSHILKYYIGALKIRLLNH